VSFISLRFTPQNPFARGALCINTDALHGEGNCPPKTEVLFPEIQIENESRKGKKASLAISSNPTDQKLLLPMSCLLRM
jgi:hypothetical protein